MPSNTMPVGVEAHVPAGQPQTAEIGVDTVDLPVPSVKPHEVANGARAETASQKEASPPMDIEDGTDIVSFVLMSFASVLIWLAKTLFVTVPFRIFSFTFLSSIAFIILSLVWLQLADDHGAVSMGAGFDSMFNRPGIV